MYQPEIGIRIPIRNFFFERLILKLFKNFKEAVGLLQSVGQTDALFIVIVGEQKFSSYHLLFYFKDELNNYEIAYVNPA